MEFRGDDFRHCDKLDSNATVAGMEEVVVSGIDIDDDGVSIASVPSTVSAAAAIRADLGTLQNGSKPAYQGVPISHSSLWASQGDVRGHYQDPEVLHAYSSRRNTPWRKPTGTMQELSRNAPTSLLNVQKTEMEELKHRGFPSGLVREIERHRDRLPLNFCILDDSASMAAKDGICLRTLETSLSGMQLDGSNRLSFPLATSCTRWEELQETALYHNRLSNVLKIPTTFLFLDEQSSQSPPPQAGRNDSQVGAAVVERFHNCALRSSNRTMERSRSGGRAPLSNLMRDLAKAIAAQRSSYQIEDATMSSAMLLMGGFPSEAKGETSPTVRTDFVLALNDLLELPVRVLIRLCSRDPDVAEFCASLAENSDGRVLVMHDWVSEARKVFRHNAWINYALPLHRYREMGRSRKVFDLIGRRSLSRTEIVSFLITLFWHDDITSRLTTYDLLNAGTTGSSRDMASACSQWVSDMQRHEMDQLNPISKRMEPWIDTQRLRQAFNRKRASGGSTRNSG